MSSGSELTTQAVSLNCSAPLMQLKMMTNNQQVALVVLISCLAATSTTLVDAEVCRGSDSVLLRPVVRHALLPRYARSHSSQHLQPCPTTWGATQHSATQHRNIGSSRPVRLNSQSCLQPTTTDTSPLFCSTPLMECTQPAPSPTIANALSSSHSHDTSLCLTLKGPQ